MRDGPQALRLDDPGSWRWLPLALLRHRLPAQLRAWVELESSMTRALAARFGEPIGLQVRQAGPVRATPMEVRGLGLRRAGERVFGREIELLSGRVVLLRARTVTPLRDPSVPLLEGLGRRPLAELLFESPRFVRDRSVDVILPRPVGPSIGRCCRWHLLTRRRTGTLLVEEYFQPAFLDGLASGP